MFPAHPLKALLKEKLKDKGPSEVESAAVTRLNTHLTEQAQLIAEEASNGNYYRVTPLDIDRGIELIRLRHLRDELKKKDSLVLVSNEVAERLNAIERRK